MENKKKDHDGPSLSVVIPAHNEEGCIGGTVRDLTAKLTAAKIDHEIIVVNDGSKDQTEALLQGIIRDFTTVRYVNNQGAHGFGLAIRRGLTEIRGECVAIYMADASDCPDDLVRFYRTMRQTGVDCVFGHRWGREGQVYDYPKLKYFLNRLANALISVVFGLRYFDTTNAFKLYRKEVIDGVQPLLSPHFNLTIEIPLKAIVRGFNFAVVPNSWTNRATGVSKLKIKEMGSRYLFILLYCLIEKWLCRGDYHRQGRPLDRALVLGSGRDQYSSQTVASR